jgi:hypothetical protein
MLTVLFWVVMPYIVLQVVTKVSNEPIASIFSVLLDGGTAHTTASKAPFFRNQMYLEEISGSLVG